MQKHLLIMCALLLATSCAAKTHVVMPWVSTEKTLALDVDWVIRYYDPEVVSVPEMVRMFGGLKAAGYSTALVIGGDLREGDSYDGWLMNLSRAVLEMRSVTDMFVLWDDPQLKGGVALRNGLAAALTKEFPDARFGVSVDVKFPVSSLNPVLPDLNYSYFSVIVGYSYGGIPWSFWPNLSGKRYVPGGQGTYDVGETLRVEQPIQRMREIASKYGAEVWFTDNAHFNANSTTTTTQMLLDFVGGSLAGADSFGWFMCDIYGEFEDTYYTGDMVAPDAWSRYYFLTTILIPLARSRLLDIPNMLNALEARVERLEMQIGELPGVGKKVDSSRIAVVTGLSGGLALFAMVVQRR